MQRYHCRLLDARCPHCCGGYVARNQNCPLSQWHLCAKYCCVTSTTAHGRQTDFFTAAFRVAAAAAVVAAAAAAAAAAVALLGRCSTMCRVFSLHCLVVISLLSFLLHVSPSASSARLWVSLTLSSSRACSAALLAARQIRRRPRALRMCGPLSTRIHHAFFRHVMCLFDTSLSSYIEFISFFASTHLSCVVTSFASSCPSWASISLSSSRSF